jgi:ferredoxin-NADP reductase
MIRSMVAVKDPRPVVLFYSNRIQAEIAYAHEFRELAASHPLFKPVFILTRENPPEWDGETRRLDRDMLKKYVPDLQKADFLMCGSRGFMEAVQTILVEEGIDIKTRLRKELFD